MNLRRFVCEQYPQPWNEGRYTYATDSNIAVRVPRRAEYDGNRSGAPNVEYLFRRAETTDLEPMPIFDVHPTCPTCGHKRQGCDDHADVRLATGLYVSLRYALTLRDLKDCHVGLNRPANEDPIYFASNDCEGILMPLIPPLTLHNTIIAQRRPVLPQAHRGSA
jgi:hypothetical protein